MGILNSIFRFLGGKTQDEEQVERPIDPYPVLTRSRRQNYYRLNGDDSSSFIERLRKILSFPKTIYNVFKMVSQKLRIIFHLPRKPAEPILPLQNPAPRISTDPLLVQTLLISSPSTNLNADEEFQNDYSVVVPSQQWAPEENWSANITQIDDLMISIPDFTSSFAHASAREEMMESAVFIEPQINAPNCPSISEKEEKKKKKRKKKKRKEENVSVSVVVDEGIRRIKHYSSRHRILVVGDGDFSFSASLAVAFGSASNMIATSLDSEAFLKKNYEKSVPNIKELRSRGCKVMHGIDATKMASHEPLGHLTFDCIIYNFPFAGFFKNLSREDQLRRHRRLVSQFLKNAREMISENGEIHITHKTNEFHIEWKLESVASSRRLRLIEAVDFNHRDYPGYNTKCGFGGDNNFNCYPSKTYKFGLKMVRY